jgi:hypothetical protein
MENTKYIKDRWLNKKFERIAIKYKCDWLYYKLEKKEE